LLLPGEYQQASSREIAGRFGGAFAEQLHELPVGRWAGPIESGYGLHLVLIRERIDGLVPELEDVREAVERDWMAERRKETGEAFYQGLRSRYTVVVEQAQR
jgi:parvulin-like peptidyl-prolyl isomerase